MIKRTGLFIIAGLLASSVIINSCETEVDLIAPYKTVPVIIGVLDHTVDTQYFRINRTFLGEGDANLFANIRDSVEFPDGTVDAWIIKYQAPNASSTNINSWTKLDSIKLLPIDLPSRPPGVFYTEDVRFFYTTQPIFTPAQINNIANMRYQLRATLMGKTYKAVTNFSTLNNFAIISPVEPPPPFPINRLSFYSSSTSTFLNITFKYATNPGTARYESALRINYNVDLTNGSTLTNQFIDFNLGTVINTSSSTDEVNILFNSQSWYEFVGVQFRAIPNVKKIRVQNLQFRVTGGNSELNTYINVAQPVSQFVPVLNTYTNLSGDAIGIFASKVQAKRTFYLDEPSLGQLAFGPFTSGPCYCVLWVDGTSFNCSVDPATCP